MGPDNKISPKMTDVQVDNGKPIRRLRHRTGTANGAVKQNSDVFQGEETSKQGDASPKIGDLKTPSQGVHIYETGLQYPEWYTELSDDNILVFKKLFEMLSSSSDSAVTADSLYKELQRLDSGVAMEEVEYVVNRFKNDGNQYIHFDEFLLHMTDLGDKVVNNGNDSVVAKDKEMNYTKRQKLFYTAITKFSMKKTLQEIEKTYLSIAHQPAPHVLPYYTAGWHLIGLGPRHLEREIKRMQKKIGNSDSPYAKPLPFLIQQTMSIRNKQRGRKMKRAYTCKKASNLISNKDEKDEKNTMLVLQLSKETLEDDEIKESLRLLAARGSVVAKLPDAHLIQELRHRIYSVSNKLRQSCTAVVESSSGIEECDSSGNFFQMDPAKYSSSTKSKSRNLSQTEVPEPEMSAHSRHRKRNPPHKFRYTSYSAVPVRAILDTKRGPGWVTPRMEFYNVPLPLFKNEFKGKKPTVDDLHEIRKKAEEAANSYYKNLRQAAINQANQHWNKLSVDLITPKKVMENFKQVYLAYSPQKEDATFLIYPWIPGPFGYVKHGRKNNSHSRSTLSSTSRSGRRSRRNVYDIVCRPKTVAI
ncbi:hypothetical protein CHS0354_026517 [Potamilus streckersoni]|uniref:EF-hand domain-containing protein n=1 Tax=Potamilus streckersoni TaxID=2493646 RepID=A0AAE0RQB4_9BIVA|nr:hypothetical protein CHS0354_026517 [Potamilus streckersoni]